MKTGSITISKIVLIVANLIPLIGVFFFGWDPKTIFVIYILESVVAGIFNVIKMLSVYFIGNKEVALRREPGDSGVSGLGIIPFFMVHYFFFIYIQCIFFFSYFQKDGDSFNPVQMVRNFEPYVFSESGYAVGGLLLSYTVSYSMDFMLSGEFNRTSLSQLFFRPYKRIFVQQFVVLLGGFIFIIFSLFLPKAGLLAFVTLFTTVKIWFDLYFENKVKASGATYKFD